MVAVVIHWRAGRHLEMVWQLIVWAYRTYAVETLDVRTVAMRSGGAEGRVICMLAEPMTFGRRGAPAWRSTLL